MTASTTEPSFPHPRVAVVPAAGSGSRLSPLTDAVPKELLPLGRRVLLDHIADELIEAAYDHLVVVSSPSKPSLDRYVLDHLRPRADQRGATVDLVHQGPVRGNAGAVLAAVDAVGSREVLVVWGDEVFLGGSRAEQVTDAYRRTGLTTIALVEVDDEDVEKCGIAVVDPEDPRRVLDLLEKPSPASTASRTASVGGYVLTAEALDALEQVDPSADGERYLSSALRLLARRGRVRGASVSCTWFETGSHEGYERAWAAYSDAGVGVGHG